MIDIILLVLIFISLFVDYSRVIPDNNILKILFLLAIIAVSFYNIKISILLTVLFFVIIIKLNKKVLSTNKEQFNISVSYYPDVYVNEKQQKRNESIKESCIYYDNKTDISTKQQDFFLDEKTKPYEEYIKKLVNHNSLKIIQDNSIDY
jgi:hypothetical protein